jgi:hypothetical protein
MSQIENKNRNRRTLDDPVTVKWILRVFYAVCALLFVMDFVIHRHVSHEMEGIPGFYAIYGFVGCVVLVVVARWMRVVLMRDEDYYEIKEEEHENINNPAKEANHVDR